ncbi:MAG: hypothetical protein GX352_05570, partial [Clostridiales bacterium]|nr:hypothetical protein [Clostridiales bacterium]
MDDSKRKALIWGSGKIGRGFIADILNKGGYSLTFVDSDKELTDKLKDRRSYTIINAPGKGEEETITIQDYEVYHTGEREAIRQSLSDCTMAAIVVFPTAFDVVAKEIAGVLEARAASAESGTLDILICANIPHPAKEFKEVLENHLSEKGKAYLNKRVGLIDTLLMRIAIEPTAEMKAKDPLVVLTNGYPQMPVDGTAFKGAMPQIHEIIYTDNITAQEKRKMYTYNMIHAVFAYIGSQKGYRYVAECTADNEIREIAQNTLEEVSEGLQKEFGFTKVEMDAWNRQVMKNMSNELLSDGLIRVGGDPIRKLKREDRLTGPALLC